MSETARPDQRKQASADDLIVALSGLDPEVAEHIVTYPHCQTAPSSS